MDPPPPYSEKPQPISTKSNSIPTPVATTSNQPRILHIYGERSLLKTTYRISDSDRKTLLYTLEVHHWSQPHILVYSGVVDTSKPTSVSSTSNQPIGTITHHSMSNKADIVVHGIVSRSESTSIFSTGRRFKSNFVQPGGQLTWRDEGAFTRNKVCLDDSLPSDGPIARMRYKALAVTKLGTLELLREDVRHGKAMDEILITLLGARHWNGDQQSSH